MIKKTLVLSFVLFSMFLWTTNSFCQEMKPTSEELLQYGKLRYLMDYRRDWSKPTNISTEESTRTTLVHIISPVSGCYDGLPERKILEKKIAHFSQYAHDLHSKGILVISYLATTRINGDPEKRNRFFDFYDNRWDQYKEYFGPRPVDPVQWARLDSQGKECTYYPADYADGMVQDAVCYNHPAVDQYVQGAIKLQVEIGSDGIFIDDSPIFCFCPICNTKFRTYLKNKYNPDELLRIFKVKDITEVDPRKFMEERLFNIQNPLVIEWKRFRPLDYTEHLKELRAYGDSLKPGFILIDNACLWEGDPYRAYNYAVGPIEEWAKVGSSPIFIEAQFDAYSHGGQDLKVTNSPVLKYAAGASRGISPTYLSYLGDPTSETHNPISALNPLLKLSIAESNANQASYVYLPVWEGYGAESEKAKAAEEIVRGVSEYNSFLAKNEHLFLGSKPYTNVAILISVEQTYAGYKTYAMAVSRMLLDEQIPHVMLVDDDVKPEVLEKYDLVILPEVPMMSDDKLNTLERYVKEGGGLLVMGPSAKYDEIGRPRKKLGISRLFKDKEPWGHLDHGIDQTLGVNTILKNEYEKGRVIFIPTDAYISLPMTGREKVVIFEGLSFVTTGKLLSLNQVFGEIVQWAAGGSYPVYCLAPYTVECHPLIQPDKSRIVVHLVNYKVDLEGNIIEEKDTRLKVLLPEGTKAKKVKLVSPDDVTEKVLEMKELNENGQNYVEFIVPSISIYSLAVIEYMVR
ncbi:MAG: beta-galactosidase trimerization domain-containing protein [Bacteroidales bacterium]|nr:beta-galactosidase trimerization domain-containing protein [Bacteroidales bacterium]